MKLKMPDLVPGHPYHFKEVMQYMDRPGVYLSQLHDYSATVGWRNSLKRSDDEIILEYLEVPVQTLEPHVQELHDLFATHPKEMDHVYRIKDLLMAGEVAWPLLIMKRYQSSVCPEARIHEGMHKAVAHQLISSEVVPVFVMRYIDDTDGHFLD